MWACKSPMICNAMPGGVRSIVAISLMVMRSILAKFLQPLRNPENSSERQQKRCNGADLGAGCKFFMAIGHEDDAENEEVHAQGEGEQGDHFSASASGNGQSSETFHHCVTTWYFIIRLGCLHHPPSSQKYGHSWQFSMFLM